MSRGVKTQRVEPTGSRSWSAAGAAAGVPLRRALAAVPVTLRVWSFSAGIATCALLLYLTQLRGLPAPAQPFNIPWPVLAIGFFLAELKVVDVHFRREKHSFSLSEFPAVLGLFLLSPDQYLMAMLLGSGSALVYFRQPPLKFAFNLSNFAISAAVSLTVFHLLASPISQPTSGDWLAAFAGTLAATVVSAFAIATAISLSGGAPQYQKLPEMIQFGTLVAVANTSLALLAVSILWIEPRLLWLLVVPLGTVFLAYRAYLSEREKGQRLEFPTSPAASCSTRLSSIRRSWRCWNTPEPCSGLNGQRSCSTPARPRATRCSRGPPKPSRPPRWCRSGSRRTTRSACESSRSRTHSFTFPPSATRMPTASVRR